MVDQPRENIAYHPLGLQKNGEDDEAELGGTGIRQKALVRVDEVDLARVVFAVHLMLRLKMEVELDQGIPGETFLCVFRIDCSTYELIFFPRER